MQCRVKIKSLFYLCMLRDSIRNCLIKTASYLTFQNGFSGNSKNNFHFQIILCSGQLSSYVLALTHLYFYK